MNIRRCNQNMEAAAHKNKEEVQTAFIDDYARHIAEILDRIRSPRHIRSTLSHSFTASNIGWTDIEKDIDILAGG